MLWPELIDGQLTPDQEDALVAGLLGVLDRETRWSSVITALGKSGRRGLISRITAELRQAIGADAWVVHQGCYTLRDLLAVGPARRLGQAERAVFLDAARAIGEAVTPDRPYPPSSPATGYIPDPREAAVQTLASVAFRFVRRAEWRGFPRRWRDQPAMTMVVREIEAALPAPMAIFGPYEGPGPEGTELRTLATVHGADGHEVSATWSGCSFDLSGWPPRMGFLLQGVDAGELVPGSVVTVDLSEQVAITRGIAEGSLQRVEYFGDVRRDGLGPDRFAVLFQPPERVRVPMPPGTPLNQSAVDWFRTLDALGKPRRGPRRDE
jgi:hypothetical protein